MHVVLRGLVRRHKLEKYDPSAMYIVDSAYNKSEPDHARAAAIGRQRTAKSVARSKGARAKLCRLYRQFRMVPAYIDGFH